MPETRTTYFCVDIEASGPVPSLYDMISLGAVVVAADPATGRLACAESFYAEIVPQAPRFEARTIPIHGLTPAHLRDNGIARRDFALQLADWVRAHTRPGTTPTFVGHNAPFDWSFVAWVYAAEELDNPFGYKGLCTKSMSTGALQLHWLDSNKETIHERLGLPQEDQTLKHRADYDAKVQAEILIKLLEHIGQH